MKCPHCKSESVLRSREKSSAWINLLMERFRCQTCLTIFRLPRVLSALLS